MRLKEDAMGNGQLKPAFNLQHGVDSEYVTWLTIGPQPTDTTTLIPFLKDAQQHLKFKYKAFFVGLWHIIEVNGTALYNGYTEMSKYVTAAIENEMLQNVLYWLVLLLLFAVTFILFCLPFYFMWKAWRGKILEAVNLLTIALSLLLLLIVVYLGEYVKLVLSMNLLGLWLIGTIIIIAVCIYVTDCMKYRR